MLSFDEKEVTLILRMPIYILATILPLSMIFFMFECIEKIFRICIALRLSKECGPMGFLDKKPKKSEIELEIEEEIYEELSLEDVVSDSRD